MTTSDIQQARGWAERLSEIEDLRPGPSAAIRVIQSLPDHIIDAEKLQEVIFHMREDSIFNEDLHPHVNALECLLPPKPPTLADMTEEERKACQWMQCEIDGQIAGILARVDKQRGHIWTDSGYSLGWKLENITPLPDLPKLQWPGNEVVEPPALPEGMRLADHEEYGRVVTSPWGDGVDDYKIFFLNEDVRAGADYEYAHESTLTFLDGDHHA